MEIPTQLATTTVGMAIKFLFDEARLILQERRERRKQLGEADDATSTSTQAEKQSKEALIQEALKASLDVDTDEEIKLLLDLIEIEKMNRDRAKRQVALQGGLAFASPLTLASLELAEDKILEHTRVLKKLLEGAFGHQIVASFFKQE